MSEKIKGGKQARVGHKFFESIENIKNARLRNGKSKERVSTEKITNLIVRHNSWQQIIKDIESAPEEEIDKYGI